MLWGPDRGCLRGKFTRDKPMSEKARKITPRNQDDDSSLKFRFRTLGRGSYAAVVYVGLRHSESPWNVNAIGVIVFRHNEKIGLVGGPFVWDSVGESHENKQRVSLKYDTTYDVSCVYSAADKRLAVSFRNALSEEQVGATNVLQLPPNARWSADRLACWNYADGYAANMELTVLIDQLQLDDDDPLTFAADLSELPVGDDKRFSHYQAPLPPLIKELNAPREVIAGEDAKIEAVVQEGLTGAVRFSLKKYSGETVWTKAVEVKSGRASAVLTSAEAERVEKGSRVLVATANEQTERSAYSPMCLRGRTFRDVTEAPPELRPGDEIVITDMSLLRPSNAISERSVKGKWWLRRYKAPGNLKERALLAVEEDDPQYPASCLAPPLRLPLKIDGWYEVWVRTYRPQHTAGAVEPQGGIDVRLSNEKYFYHVNPLEIGSVHGRPHPPYRALVDILYRAADLSGQYLIFQQPYGAYASDTKLCTASLAGVRLVKLSKERIANIQAERARKDASIIGYDNDGFSYFWKWGAHNRACIARLVEPLRDQSAAFLNIELGGLGGLIIPTPYTGMYQMSSGHVRDGDLRANAFFRWCFENKVNILNVLTDHAHNVGVKIFASLMMERCFSYDETMRAHPEWRVKRGQGTWNYALPEVQDYQVKKMAWIIENHDLDGFIVDFTRYGHFFNQDEPNKFDQMNNFLRKLRAAVDAINVKKDRKVSLCASFGDRSWHLKHWGTGDLVDQGLAVKTWLSESLFDIIMPEGPTAPEFVGMARDSRTKVWPRKVASVTLRSHSYVKGLLSPKEIEKEIKWALDHGAPGVFFFNHETWGAFRRLGFREELELRTRVDEIYGYREGPTVSFTTWYPNAEERADQRKAFKPLTIAPDAGQKVDGDVLIPIRNTFARPVTATVNWTAPEKRKAKPWIIRPARRSVEIAPGEEEKIAFHLTGTAVTYKAVPAAKIEMSVEGQVVLRCQSPLRAVPQMSCRKVSSAPRIDGDLRDPIWASAGGLKSKAFFLVGQAGRVPWKARMGFAYDEKNLYVAYECSGVDVSHIERSVQQRDSREIYQSDNIQILVDPAATEQAYFAFVVTPAGGQADYRAYYYDFAGQFTRKRDWQADWQAATAWQKNGYSGEMAIPFAALRAEPKAGDAWRLNVVVQSLTADGKAAASWSSPDEPFHLPRHFGTLHGSLVFVSWTAR